jgi:hypothetical protein
VGLIPGRLWSALGGSPRRALSHRLAAWFHRHAPPVGDEDRASFQDAYRKTLAQNLLFLEVTKDVLIRFEKAGVPVIPLKGVCFASRFFGDLGVRVQSDVDVLVRPSALGKAHDLLICEGWHQAVPREKSTYHWVYTRDGVLLELHWALRSPGLAQPDASRLWAASRPARREGLDILEFSAEDTLLYLAANKAQQRHSFLADFLDAAALLSQQEPLDWDAVLYWSRREGLRPHLWFLLSFLEEATGVVPPQEVLFSLGRGPQVWGARAVRLFRRALGGPGKWGSSAPWTRLLEGALEGTPARVAALARKVIYTRFTCP